jgi:hypothetical protein
MRGLYHRPYRTFNGGGCWTRSGSMLMRTLFRLRFRVSAIEEKGYDLFEWFFVDINGAMDPNKYRDNGFEVFWAGITK